MTHKVPLLVFSDLDGTLLDHETYQWNAATEALGALRDVGAGLVLASSKTAPEICDIRAAIGFDDWPAIVENGAGILPAGTHSVAADATYDTLRTELDALPRALRSKFCGFGDQSVAALSERTGLPPAQAARAKQRAFSEPGTWSGTEAALEDFLAHLAEVGIIGQKGGRFVTLSFGGNKADRVHELTRKFGAQHTLALGDAPNDIKMLESADRAVVVHNPHATPLPKLRGEEAGHILRTQAAGPTGWNAAVLAQLKDLNIKRT
ncbi:HAD-IIB family hydrolase [Cognatishimia sp. SS12]|uniref:HAD-IIB family hydrolase n=1 Tax=Cognatishimia sp. SS12 TaxID=2979465 RepID=UPI00232AF529|nr:HAD-IIB family hydrolase [Cognatishimia sp. SS12]MDC0736661.1 HAD-IIB family hydrolase [Cognatishimia sp. SS12]